MSKTTPWPETLDEALRSNVNVYIDASGSMWGAGRLETEAPPFERALAYVRARGATRVHVFDMRGVTHYHGQSDEYLHAKHGGGDGLQLALADASRQRRRALVVSDGDHGAQPKRGQSWALALIPAGDGFDATAMRAAHLHPARIYEVPTPMVATASRASDVAGRMAQASRAAAIEARGSTLANEIPGSIQGRTYAEVIVDDTLSPTEQARANLELLAEEIIRLSKREAWAPISGEALLAADEALAEKRAREADAMRAEAKRAWDGILALATPFVDGGGTLIEAIHRDTPETYETVERFRTAAKVLLDYFDHEEERRS